MSHLLNTAGMAPAEAAAWPNATEAAAPALPSVVRLAWNATLPKGCNKLVLMCLAYHACKNERAECFPHVETVARLCGIHPRTASLQLRALATAGLIAVLPRPGRSSVYRLIRARLAALSSERPAAVGQIENPPEPSVQDPVPPAQVSAQDLRQDPAFPAPPPVIPALTPGVFCTHKGEEGGRKEEGRASVRETSDMPLFDQPSLPSPDDEIFKTLNANRVAHGKRRLVAADVKELAVQALLAGRSLVDAARHAGDSGWRWFCADWRGASAAAPAAPAQLDEAGKAQARARAQALYDERLRASIANRHQPAATVVLAPSAAPITARTASPRSATVPSASPISNPVAMGMTGTGWAHTAVARFVAGQPLSRATLTSAVAALGLSLSDLKAQRAAATQGAAA